MKINGFDLVNADKVERAINGSTTARGAMVGGVGTDAAPEALLAEYDKLGGLIKKGKYKVKMGTFYDFKKSQPVKEPKVIFVVASIEGGEIEVPEGEDMPIEARAAEIKNKKKSDDSDEDESEDAEPTTEKPKKGGKKAAKKSDDSDEDESEDAEPTTEKPKKGGKKAAKKSDDSDEE